METPTLTDQEAEAVASLVEACLQCEVLNGGIAGKKLVAAVRKEFPRRYPAKDPLLTAYLKLAGRGKG